MQIHIHKNGQQFGPFPESRIAEMLKSGEPPDTILLQAKSKNRKSTITFLKDGSGKIERPGQQPSGHPAPRTPAFLK